MRKNQFVGYILPFAGLILVFLFFLIMTQGRMIKPSNISNIIDQVFTTLIVSVGAIFVYAHGGFDMSVSAICGIAQLAMAALVTATDARIHPLLVLLVGVVICVVISMLNAIVHLELKVPIFVVTLCTMFACSGLLANIAQKQIYSVPMMYLSTYNQTPVRLLTLLVIVVIGWVLFEKTKLGKIQKVIGGSPVVSLQSGIDVKKNVFLAFVTLGVTVGIAAFFTLSRLTRVTAASGGNLQTNIMIAIVLGGMPLSGGATSRLSSVICGAITVTLLTNGMTLMGMNAAVINAVKGILFVLIIAISYKRSPDGLYT
ncbi:D-allose transport system permease protein AlsC [Lachnospiraceae bacterium]|nr:D-allose transport system permease protein AlsC [Lachnospiraceae bacterium]